MNITPTVGRMVYFKSRGSSDGVFPPMTNPAIITAICDGAASIEAGENCVSLVAFSPSGFRFEQHVQQGSDIGQWDWMPFQKDQQARLAKEE